MRRDSRSNAGETARRPAVLAVLADADHAVRGWSCEGTADCCRFGVTGREPYLTEAEWALIRAEVARQGRRVPSPRADQVCPFLTDGARCSIYQVRPLGCRTFHCHRGEGPKVSRAALADLPRRLEELSVDPRERGRRLTAWLAG